MATKRLARLSYATWRDTGRKDFTFTSDHWARFGANSGVPLKDTQRRAMILDAVRAYLRDVAKEAAAPLAKNELAWLERLRTVTGDLQALVGEAKVGSAERSGLAEVQAALNSLMVQPSAFDLMMAPVCSPPPSTEFRTGASEKPRMV